MSDEIDRVGTCPVCQTLLVEMGKLVVCPNGDYRAEFDHWDRTWFAFDVAVDDADQLLKDLVDLNLVQL